MVSVRMVGAGKFAPGLLATLFAAVACSRTSDDAPNATTDGAIGVVGGQSDAAPAASGAAACLSAGGTCIPGPPENCASGKFGPPNCDPGPSGSVCCLKDIGDGASSSTLLDDGTEPDAFAEAPDAFPDDCATALPVLAEEYAATHCQLSPGNVACESTSDCIVNLLPMCCGSAAVGVNRDASLVCLPPNGCLPPPPGSGIASCSPSVATEDCRVVAARQYVGVACVNNHCMTYAVGP
jgi:hypothetical protein